MRQAEFNKIDVDSTLAVLSTEPISVEATTPTCAVQDEFERRPDVPGAIVFDGDAMLGVISRETFFRRLSGPYCRDLFLRKPVRQLLDIWQSSFIRLPADCTIHRATELVLARPPGQTYEPIVVDFGEQGLRLLDAHTLLSAQSQLLSTSRALAQQRDAADAANRSKTDFLAKVSHELRTPLHGILSYTRFGLNEVDDGERAELREFFQNVQHNAEMLLNLVNELLDYSKLEAGHMSLALEKCSLGSLVDTVVDEFRSLCAEKDVHIQYIAPNEDVYVAADDERFKQVVRNLLSNAVKFSPPGGMIHVRLRGAKQLALLSVRDEGPGIPAEDLELIFDKFFQSNRTDSVKGGTGLGLAICREIMAGHSGRVWAENNGQSGSIFYCELPQWSGVRSADERSMEAAAEFLEQLA
jgi:signal transduction histidine kinase